MQILHILTALLVGVEAARVERTKQTSSSDSGFVQKTLGGCRCRSLCQPSKWDKFKCDVCTVSVGCGKWGLGRKYDLCTYPSVASWESKSADEKLSWAWEKVLSDPTPAKYPEGVELLAAFKGSVQTTFDLYANQQPEGRGKHIHSVGSVCKIKMSIANSPYTGLLADGEHNGLIRMGGAAAYSTGFTPGIGFKFPRTGVPSGDFVAMHNTNALPGWNFFKWNMSNHIPPAAEQAKTVLAKKFEQASICSSKVGLSDFCKFTAAGKDVGTPVFPYKLFFQPTEAAATDEYTEQTPETMGAQMLEKYTVGTTLLKVFACTKPTPSDVEGANSLDNCGGPLEIGTIETASECVMSGWGDKFLHIRHQRIEEDWKLKPEYMEGAQGICGRTDEDWNNFLKKGSVSKCVACMRNSNSLVEEEFIAGKGGKKSKGGGKKSKGGKRSGKKSTAAWC